MKEQSLKQKTKKGLYWKFAEQFSNYGIQFIIGIFMARLLSPSDYGITALPAVFLAVAGIFAGAGFGSAMIRKKKLTEKDLSTSFYYSTAIGIISYIILYIASPWIADFYDIPVLKPLIRVSSLGFLYGPIGAPQNIILQRKLDFKTPAIINVICILVSGGVGITMAFYDYGVWALTISSMFAGIVGLVIKIYVVRWYPKTGWSKESFKYLWGFGNKLMISSLIDTLFNNITPIFIAKNYSTADLGVYNRAQSYAAMPSSNFTGVLQGVTYPVLSKMQDDDERLAYNYRRMLRVSAFIVFPIMMMLAALARPLIITMITAKWESCILLLQIICFSMMWYPIQAINLNLLNVKGRSDLFLRLEIIKKILGLGIILMTLPLGIIIYCWGRVAGSMFALIVNTYYTGKLINVGYWKQMGDLLPIFTLSFISFLSVQGLLLQISNLWLQIILGGLTGLIVYIGGAYLFKFKEIDDLRFLITNR